MAGGPRKHLKRIATPKHWCLDKLNGVYAPRPSAGPHKLRECIPLALLLRNKLKYAITYNEVKMIVMQKVIKVDGKVRCDRRFPIGFQDIVTIEKTNENFRILYDIKGKFVPLKITSEEAKYKLCKVKKVELGNKSIPYAYLHDGRTVRYPHPDVKVADTVEIDLESGKILKLYKFDIGSTCMITAGHSIGRIGKITDFQVVPGSKRLVTVTDSCGNVFSTVEDNVHVIGDSNGPAISLPKDKGIKRTIIEEQADLVKMH